MRTIVTSLCLASSLLVTMAGCAAGDGTPEAEDDVEQTSSELKSHHRWADVDGRADLITLTVPPGSVFFDENGNQHLNGAIRSGAFDLTGDYAFSGSWDFTISGVLDPTRSGTLSGTVNVYDGSGDLAWTGSGEIDVVQSIATGDVKLVSVDDEKPGKGHGRSCKSRKSKMLLHLVEDPATPTNPNPETFTLTGRVKDH